MTSLLRVFFTLLLILPAGLVDAEERDTWLIESVEFVGLERTREHVVMRELSFEPGQRVAAEEIDESVQRLRNLGLFRIAEHTLVETTEGRFHLVITVDERWTLLPFGNIRFGGNLFSLTAGLFEINVLGRYIETGVQYNRLGDSNSFLVWLQDPRFLDRRLLFGVDVAWTNRNRGFYERASGSFEGAYSRLRRQARVFANQEIENWLAVGLTLSAQADSFSFDLVSQEAQDSYLSSFDSLPESSRVFTVATTLRLGRINTYSYNFEGVRLVQSLAHSDPIWGATQRQTTAFTEVRAFARMPLKINLATRLGFGTTTADHIEQQFFVGGFGTLRGHLDSRFRGKHTWYGNAEVRMPSFDDPWFVLQHTVFLDAASATDRPSQLWRIQGASTGVGVRVIIPKIHGFIARADYAFSLAGDGQASLSFGAQQFF